jgi:hypothetical protein
MGRPKGDRRRIRSAPLASAADAPGPKGEKRPRDANQLGKLIVDISVGEVEDRVPTPEDEGKNPAASSWADVAG